MWRHSPSYYSPPRRGYCGSGRSPPRRKYGGYGGHRKQNGGSLLVRNIPLNYSEPRGFAFVEFVDACDASEAQYHMNHRRFGGREITVVVASETRKRHEDMHHWARVRGPSYDDHRSSGYGRSRSRTRSRSRSPYDRPSSKARHNSRSYSPAPIRRDDYSASPSRRCSARSRSPRVYPEGCKEEYNHRSYSPEDRNQAGDGYEKKAHYDGEGGHSNALRDHHHLGISLAHRHLGMPHVHLQDHVLDQLICLQGTADELG